MRRVPTAERVRAVITSASYLTFGSWLGFRLWDASGIERLVRCVRPVAMVMRRRCTAATPARNAQAVPRMAQGMDYRLPNIYRSRSRSYPHDIAAAADDALHAIAPQPALNGNGLRRVDRSRAGAGVQRIRGLRRKLQDHVTRARLHGHIGPHDLCDVDVAAAGSRVDLAAGKWCEGECKAVQSLVSATDDKIVFTDEGTLNTRMEAAREVTFDRKKGAFIHNFAQVRPDEQLLYIAATCKTEGFTPFPAP